MPRSGPTITMSVPEPDLGDAEPSSQGEGRARWVGRHPLPPPAAPPQPPGPTCPEGGHHPLVGRASGDVDGVAQAVSVDDERSQLPQDFGDGGFPTPGSSGQADHVRARRQGRVLLREEGKRSPADGDTGSAGGGSRPPSLEMGRKGPSPAEPTPLPPGSGQAAGGQSSQQKPALQPLELPRRDPTGPRLPPRPLLTRGGCSSVPSSLCRRLEELIFSSSTWLWSGSFISRISWTASSGSPCQDESPKGRQPGSRRDARREGGLAGSNSADEAVADPGVPTGQL